MNRKPVGRWSGNQFWRHTQTSYRKVAAPKALSRWAQENPEEAAMVRARFEKEQKQKQPLPA